MVLIEFEIDIDDVYWNWMQSDSMLDAGTKDGHKEEVKNEKVYDWQIEIGHLFN